MPIPTPMGTEDEETFMGRCISDSTMQSEYSNQQRIAICSTSWDERNKKSMSEMQIDNQEQEFKYIDIQCELKMETDEDKGSGRFSGYASIFGNKDLGNDVVEKGAFTKSLRNKSTKSVKMLYQHKTDEPIGVYKKLEEDDKGLYVEGQLAMGTQRGKEVYELMKMGAIDGLSIGYKVDAKGYDYDERGKRRKLKEVDLMEISAVTFPMNPKARVRKVKGVENTIRDWEEILREVGGLSRNESKMGAKALTQALSQRDVEDGKPELLNSITNLTQLIKGE
tara:strand:- start:1172 stop:2011 length:840 start_codon:yes stop_codon:yes gene_type:complete